MVTVTREQLQSIEWSGYNRTADDTCPACRSDQRVGHEPNCWLAVALASDPPGLYRQGQEDMRRRVLDIVRDPSDCRIVKKLPIWGVPGMSEAAAAVAPLVERAQQATGGSDASDFRMRQSDPPGLVALMVEWKRLRKAVNDADNGREGPPWSLIEECKAAYERVLAYPLPASPQAKED